MKQIDGKKLCKYCYGCNKLENENFKGIMRCKDFVAGIEDWQDKWRKELKKN